MDFSQTDQPRDIQVGAVILAPGFKGLFDYDVGSPGGGPSPWKVLGEELTLEAKPM